MHAQDFVMILLVLLAVFLWNRWAVREDLKKRTRKQRRFGVIPTWQEEEEAYSDSIRPSFAFDPRDTQAQDLP